VGWIYLKKGDSAKAIETLERARAKAEGDPSINYHLGMAYLKAAKKDQAKECLKKALAAEKDFPGKEEAKKALSAL